MASIDPVFSCFAFYGVLLVIKMYIIAIITGQVRLRKKVSWLPEKKRRKESRAFAAEQTRSQSHSPVFVPEGICQPGGRAQTRRAAVPQRRSLRGAMSEVNARSEKNLSQLVFNSAAKTHEEFCRVSL